MSSGAGRRAVEQSASAGGEAVLAPVRQGSSDTGSSDTGQALDVQASGARPASVSGAPRKNHPAGLGTGAVASPRTGRRGPSCPWGWPLNGARPCVRCDEGRRSGSPPGPRRRCGPCATSGRRCYDGTARPSIQGALGERARPDRHAGRLRPGPRSSRGCAPTGSPRHARSARAAPRARVGHHFSTQASSLPKPRARVRFSPPAPLCNPRPWTWGLFVREGRSTAKRRGERVTLQSRPVVVRDTALTGVLPLSVNVLQ